MSGLKWLDGKNWIDVTRDERFFCAHLYKVILETPDGLQRFVALLNKKLKNNLSLPLDANWELGYEVCFYRDLLFHQGEKIDRGLSLKRTFDLCLFSDDWLVIIEAKVYEAFGGKQTEDFCRDKQSILENLGLPVKPLLVPLASSGYCDRFSNSSLVEKFDANLVSWKDLYEEFKDTMLEMADGVYARRPAAGSFNEELMPGSKLVNIFLAGDYNPAAFWVGCAQGLKGLKQSLAKHNWFQTNSKLDKAPNRNWFSLEDFAREVGLKKGYACPLCPAHRDNDFVWESLLGAFICQGCYHEIPTGFSFEERPTLDNYNCADTIDRLLDALGMTYQEARRRWIELPGNQKDPGDEKKES